MDQLKVFLRQAIRHRFWIAVGISALLPMIAYAVGSGPIKKKAEDETRTITSAEKAVQPFRSPGIPNDQYKPLVDKEKAELSQDVNASWRKLYAQQAPLLTWPETVEKRFQDWGRKWPENVDASAVQFAIIDYVQAYPAFVTGVYQTLHAFDPIEGTGVVSAPSESNLLRPAPFTIQNPPALGKVWAAQERLWVQRALLQVVADVNSGAKDWKSAVIKQLNWLEVGNQSAEDQVSLGKGVVLEEAAALDPPGTAAATPAEGSSGGQREESDSVYYMKNDSTQYKILPVALSVLIDQERVSDLLIALENSPLAIQVVDFDLAKPSTRVAKPEKGGSMNFSPGMYAMVPQMMRPGITPMTAFGGTPAQAYNPMGNRPGTDVRKGIDTRTVDRSKEREKNLERARKATGVTLHDPYYYIVQVNIYGQARFYNPPPVEAAPEPSQAASAPAEGAAAATPEAAKAESSSATAKSAESAKPATATEAAKAESPKADGETAKTKDETAKVKDEPAKAKDEPAKTKGEPAKAKDEPAKAKDEPAKTKGEPAKAKDEPAKAKGEPAKAKGEPAKAKDEPAKAKDDSAKGATPKT